MLNGIGVFAVTRTAVTTEHVPLSSGNWCRGDPGLVGTDPERVRVALRSRRQLPAAQSGADHHGWTRGKPAQIVMPPGWNVDAARYQGHARKVNRLRAS